MPSAARACRSRPSPTLTPRQRRASEAGRVPGFPTPASHVCPLEPIGYFTLAYRRAGLFMPPPSSRAYAACQAPRLTTHSQQHSANAGQHLSLSWLALSSRVLQHRTCPGPHPSCPGSGDTSLHPAPGLLGFLPTCLACTCNPPPPLQGPVWPPLACHPTPPATNAAAPLTTQTSQWLFLHHCERAKSRYCPAPLRTARKLCCSMLMRAKLAVLLPCPCPPHPGIATRCNRLSTRLPVILLHVLQLRYPSRRLT
mgnify:CR=1 FL=1